MAMIGRNATIADNGEYRCRQEEKFDALGRGYSTVQVAHR